MNKLKSLFTYALLTCSTLLFAQPDYENGNLLFTIKLMAENTYGVFVKPDQTIAPSQRISTGSGQVTLVAPVDFYYTHLENHGGTWIENARVDGPIEASDKAYISFGFVTDEPKIQLYPEAETLLFTFETEDQFAGTFKLIENNNDPFSTPNSYGTNPGNDLGIIDFGGNGGMKYYTYGQNYYNDSFTPETILANKTEEIGSDNNNRTAKAVLTATSEGPK